MTPTHQTRLTRRAFLAAATIGAVLLSTTAMTQVALGEEQETDAFDFDILTERMRVMATSPFEPAAPELPGFYATLL